MKPESTLVSHSETVIRTTTQNRHYTPIRISGPGTPYKPIMKTSERKNPERKELSSSNLGFSSRPPLARRQVQPPMKRRLNYDTQASVDNISDVGNASQSMYSRQDQPQAQSILTHSTHKEDLRRGSQYSLNPAATNFEHPAPDYRPITGDLRSSVHLHSSQQKQGPVGAVAGQASFNRTQGGSQQMTVSGYVDRQLSFSHRSQHIAKPSDTFSTTSGGGCHSVYLNHLHQHQNGVSNGVVRPADSSAGEASLLSSLLTEKQDLLMKIRESKRQRDVIHDLNRVLIQKLKTFSHGRNPLFCRYLGREWNPV